VLSISTAGKNRYLFHFSNVNALTQWTAGIRLAMFENSSLQEAYTGSLIAGKGKNLNNIKMIMAPAKFNTEEWTRVRFGAGTPWRRCWCVIAPPDEKAVAAHKKQMKKKSAYDRSTAVLKGTIKFYDTRKTKKVTPIATISDAYSAYAIYPQSKPLIDQSTLIKVEGTVTIHSQPPTTTEGTIFIMPEVRPAVSGFEMMLRFLFPVYDVFAMYGRPARLAADTLDTRSLMFAMPQNSHWGYLEIFDIATLIHTPGSQGWNEREWKKQLKHLTSQRISITRENGGSKTQSRAGSRHGHRNSLPSRSGLRFQDNASMRSTPSLHRENEDEFVPKPPPHTDSAPPGNGPFQPPPGKTRHFRSVSESVSPMGSPKRRAEPAAYSHSRLSHEQSRRDIEEEAPAPPMHGVPITNQDPQYSPELEHDRSSSEDDRRHLDASHMNDVQNHLSPNLPPAPVVAPPAFSHEPGAKPPTRPYHSPELRRANSRMSSTTLSQLAAAGNPGGTGSTAYGAEAAAAGASAAWGRSQSGESSHGEDRGQRGVINNTSRGGMTADNGLTNKGMVLDGAANPPGAASRSDPYGTQSPYDSHNPTANSEAVSRRHSYLNTSHTGNQRSVSPLSQSSSASATSNHSYPSQVVFASQTSSRSIQTLSSQPLPHTEKPLPQRPQINTRQSIARKPIGRPVQQAPLPSPPAGNVAVQSPKYAIDESAFNRVNTMRSNAPTEVYGRRHSGDSSHYTESPSYASTMDSATVPPPIINRSSTRTGILKMVGTTEENNNGTAVGDAKYQQPFSQSTTGFGNLDIDFGPTQLYKPDVPSSKPVEPPVAADRDHSEERNAITRDDSFGLLALSGNGRVSPGHVIDAYNRSPNRSHLVTPEPSSRPPSNESDDRRRSVAWQPGAVIGGASKRQSISAEQFVQERYTSSRVTPVYAHARQQSSSSIQKESRRTSRTPPLTSRQSSGDWSARLGRQSPLERPQSRGASSTMNIGQTISPARPQSRGASSTMNLDQDSPIARPQSRGATSNLNLGQAAMPARPQSRGASSTMNLGQDYSAHLSAREQEHVARVTGSPLINLTSNNHNRSSPQGGLISAIEAREQEKKDFKSGASRMVQQAINQRQQQAAQQAQQSQFQQQQQQQIATAFSQPSPQFHIPGQFPPSPGQYFAASGYNDSQQQWGQGVHNHPNTNYGINRSQSSLYNYGQYPQTPSPQQWNQQQQQQQQHPGQGHGGYFGGR
jgi:CCR4-NOT transcriptional complex subunit CAF120